MTIPIWLDRLLTPKPTTCETLNIPAALFRKWMKEAADEIEQRKTERPQ